MITSEWPTKTSPHAAPFIVRQAEYIRQAGVDVHVFHFCGRKNPFRYFFAWWQVRKLLLSRNFDLIHAQWGQSALLAIPKKIPLVVTFRGSDLDGMLSKRGNLTFSGWLLRNISKHIATFADMSIVVSRHLANYLYPVSKYTVIPSGVNLELFLPMEQLEARDILGLSQQDKIVLFVGNSENPDKRFDLAKKATYLINNGFPPIRLIVANNVPYKQMTLYMNASDVLILSSAHEGSPNVIKEALACNLPIVSTDVGDVRERIGSIEGCEVCADDRPETIAAALTRVLSRGQRINGRQAVLELDEKLLTQKVIQVYYRAIQGKKQA